jgi:hypothetical protein
MPRPPSFGDPVAAPAKARKPARKSGKAAAAGTEPGSGSSYERPNRFVPAEFDRERRGVSGSGAQPMMSSSGRPAMGMRF